MLFQNPAHVRWACVVFLGSITIGMGSALYAAELPVQPQEVDTLISAVLVRNPNLAAQQFPGRNWWPVPVHSMIHA